MGSANRIDVTSKYQASTGAPVESTGATLRRFYGRHRGALAAVTIISLIAQGVSLAFPQALRLAIDGGLEGIGLNALGPLLAGLVALQFVLGVFTARELARIGGRVVEQVRADVIERMLALPPSWHQRNSSAAIASRLSADLLPVRGLAAALVGGVSDVISSVAFATMLFLTSWRLAGLSTLIVPVFVLIAASLIPRLRRMQSGMREAEADVAQEVGTLLDSVATVQAFTQEASSLNRVKTLLNRSLRHTVQLGLVGGVFGGLLQVGAGSCVVLVVWYGGSLMSSHALTAGQLSAFLVYLVFAVQTLTALSGRFSALQAAFGSADRLVALLQQRSPIREAKSPTPLPEGARVELDGVTFAYEDKPLQPALVDVFLTVEPGSWVALVGRSGAGKSTLVSLLLRFLDPIHGRVLLNGVDTRDLRLSDLRTAVSLVPQTPALFPGTVRANIAFGKPDATEEEIRAAAEQANATAFIERMPKGFDTVLTARPTNLSGGERQRLALARALLTKPRVLILDEVSSALDSESERAIHQCIVNCAKTAAVLVIAHRMNTIRSAAHIAVMDRGAIVEEGTHEDLMRLGGLYRNMVELQSRDELLEAEVTSLYGGLS